jgi:phosphonate transport system substrate-binding protein
MFAAMATRLRPCHLLGCVMILMATTVRAETTLVFASYTSEQPSALVAQLRPALDAISRRMTVELADDVTIRMQIMRNYEEGVRLIADRQADFMRVGPASYVKARELDPGITVLAVENIGGKSTFNGVIAVHRDSPIHSIADLKGKAFAFGSPESTLGRYFAQQFLLRAGIRSGDLSRSAYLERHDKVGAAVGSGLFDAGALEETMFRKLIAGGTPIRALVTFPNVTRPWIARSNLDTRIYTALRRSLLELDDKAALQVMRFDGFLSGKDSDFEATRQAIADSREFDDRRN